MMKLSTNRTVLAVILSLALMGCESGAPGGKSGGAAAQPAQPVIRQATAELSQTYAAVRKSQISEVDYKLSVSLNRDSEFFSAKVDAGFKLALAPVSPITLDFNQGEVDSIRVNGKSATWDYDKWFISLAPELFTQGENTLVVTYRRKYSTDGSGLHRIKDPETGDIYMYTDFEPHDANRLFPHFDQPNLKASFTLDVVAPAHWQVISTTREEKTVENTADGTRHWYFPASPKISSYVFSLHAGPFQVWEDRAGDIPLRLFARKSMAGYIKTEDWFKPTKQSFAFYNQYFGLKYPFGKYDQVIVPDFNAGAMENVGAVTFSEYYVSRGEKSLAMRRRLANTIAHEMAHMWFGDLVTMDWWNGLWLNESFATYMAFLELDKASEFKDIWDVFYAGTKQWAYYTDQLVTTHPIELPVPTTGDAFTNFDGITYGKGASVLKQLGHLLGEDAFRQGVSNYLKKYAYQNTSLEDFITELGLAANKNLDQWTRQWLYEAGLNTIAVNFECDSQQKITKMTLNQTAPESYPTLREQRVQLGLFRQVGDTMQRQQLIPVTYSGAVTSIDAAVGGACPDFVYPNVDDWGYVKITFDPRSLATLKQSINSFSRPGMRLMLWQNLWDGVTDIQLPLTEFTEFALANLSGESDYNVVRQVVRHLRNAYDYYAELNAGALKTGKDYSENMRAIEAFIWSNLEQAKAGSELQKTWFDGFNAVAHTPDALNKAVQLLSGKLQLKGLEIDQDKRWNLIISLNRFQYGSYAQLLKAEQARDNSDLGQKMAIVAEAVRPQKAVKEKWLNTIIDTPQAYKLSTLRNVMNSLFPSEQRYMMADYSKRILDGVPALNKGVSPEFSSVYASSLAPASCSESSVSLLEKAQTDFKDFHPTIAKAFKVAHQEDQRCVDIGRLM